MKHSIEIIETISNRIKIKSNNSKLFKIELKLNQID